MPLTRVTKVFAVSDAKIAAMLTDPAGGSATYGTSVDVPGIKAVSISGNVDTKRLRGDNRPMDAMSVLTEITAQVQHAKLSFDVLPVLLGGTTSETGTTPNQVVSFELKDDDQLGYFKLEAVSVGADPVAGAVKFELPKLMLGSFPEMGLAEEDYQTHTFDVAVNNRLSDGRWIKVDLYETAPTLS